LALDCARKVAKAHPAIELAEMIVDAAAMTMVRDPNRLGVLATENLYGDILSDLGAGLVGGLGIVPGANIGESAAVFEAVPGSAPDIAGMGTAKPTGPGQRGQGHRHPDGARAERRHDAAPHRRAGGGRAHREGAPRRVPPWRSAH